MTLKVPRPEGFNSRIVYTKEQCDNFKVDEAFADVAIADWCEIDKMVNSFVKKHGML
jgi:hypothetical protein